TVATEGIFEGYTLDMRRVAENFNDLLASDYSSGTDYDITGEFYEDTITMHYGGEDYSYQINNTIKTNILSKRLNFYELSEIFDNPSADVFIRADKNVYAVYGKSGAGDSMELCFRNVETLLEKVSLRSFDGFVVFSESRRTVYVNRPELKPYLDYSLYFSKGGVSTESVKIAGKNYALSLSPLNDTDFYMGGYADFSTGDKIVSSLKNQVGITTAILVALTVFLLGFGVYLSGTGGGKSEYSYKLVVDSDGKIVKADKYFRTDYPSVTEIREKVNRFNENEFYVIKANRGDDGDFLVCAVNKRGNGTIVLNASRLAMPYGTEIETDQRNDTMEEVYDRFIRKSKQLLIGEIFFANMHDIKTVFGKNFSDEAQAFLVEKIRDKFHYVFPLDTYHVGVLFPDGKQFAAIQRDLPEIVAFFNRAIYVGDNLVNVKVKCGFALVDKTMEDRSFAYAQSAAGAALKKTLEEVSDPANSVDYNLYYEMQKKIYSRYFFNIDVVRMLDDHDFELQYQPQYSFKQGRIVAFEALLRLKKSVQISESIYDIITFAEQSGNMVPLGDFIFDEGMRFAKSVEGKNVGVSLNVSPVQLMQAGFVENFLKTYKMYDLKPRSISIEVTESFLMTTMEETLQKLEVLRSNGIDVHLDDFGTTYSSLRYLKELPISAIKIDRSFVYDIKTNRNSEMISELILNLSRELGVDSICEGVETTEQLDALLDLGADIIQGFIVSKSVPQDVAREMIDNYRYEK
ncbi:MAG: EAL domain-containing protein, partial [Clostridia bacterium]|nr:EAL domain-containing protein [Clostridia bacterium]